MEAARSWLLRATFADPDPAWICGDCGAATEAWTPTCARCGALGTIDWRTPERATAIDTDGGGLALPPAGQAVSGDTAPEILPESEPPDAMDGHDISFKERRDADSDPQR